jgi:hypothetical protein
MNSSAVVELMMTETGLWILRLYKNERKNVAQFSQTGVVMILNTACGILSANCQFFLFSCSYVKKSNSESFPSRILFLDRREVLGG